MSNLVSYELNGKVAVITIQNGKVNALSHEVFGQLNAALDQAEQDKAVVVLTGQPGIFSAGYDLKVMNESPEAAGALVKVGSTFAKRLLSFPTPVVSVCTGHAVAKGAFILLSSDLRIGVEGPFKIGLNEVAIGMIMHHAGIEIARNRLLPQYFQRSVINAEMFSPEDAVKAGFLDIVVPAEELKARAIEEATKLTQLDMRAHHQTKLKARAGYLEALSQGIEQDAQDLGLR